MDIMSEIKKNGINFVEDANNYNFVKPTDFGEFVKDLITDTDDALLLRLPDKYATANDEEMDAYLEGWKNGFDCALNEVIVEIDRRNNKKV